MKRGDTGEFEAFVLDYQQKAFSTAYRTLGNVHDARDAVQEAFVRAFKARRDFRGESAVTTWFHRIVVNVALDILRKRPRMHVVDEMPDGADPSAPRPEDRARGREMREIVMSAVSRLPERQRDVFVLKHFNGLSISEISGTLGLADGTVKVHLSRAVHKLKEELSGYDL